MRRRTYNPGQLTARELKASFIAREDSLAEMLRIVRDQADGRPCQHMLLIGARGTGKTTLGLRFLQAVREEPDLAAVWEPVPFDEESYGVTGLAEFWLAALQHVSRATGEMRWAGRADELNSSESDAGRREGYALASLLDFCEQRGRRLILFVENLDLIFAQIGDERDIHALRSALIGHPDLLLIGSANAVFDGIRRQDAPFYEFFRLITLRGLDSRSCRAVFEATMERTGSVAPGDLPPPDKGRVETIRALTGGNPRLLVLAAEMLMESPLGSAFEDLERLVDAQTPYFKALIEALPVQARKVFHHLAGKWTPMRARRIAAGVNLTTSHASAQLRQLKEKGYVREIRLAEEARARYEVADRFYNIYYLLRFSRPGRERLARFTSFLQNHYGEGAMRTLYRSVLDTLRERTVSATELSDRVQMVSGLVAEGSRYSGGQEWFESALSISVEQSGADAPLVDERAGKALGRTQTHVGPKDGPDRRRARIRGLLGEGAGYVASGEDISAVRVLQRAVDFVRPDDEADIRELAGMCLGVASAGRMELFQDDADALEANAKTARMAVELAPNNALCLQAHAQALAYRGERAQSLSVLAHALEKLGETDDSTGMSGTLIRIASRGHIAEVRDFMADTRLTKDLEPLWYALQFELGEPIGALPAEIKESMTEIQARLKAP